MTRRKPATCTIRQSVTIRATPAAVYEAPVRCVHTGSSWEPLKVWFRNR
jgi:hypothetical protein